VTSAVVLLVLALRVYALAERMEVA